MEIKYTIEILTKDIQDIEKLVGNLQNSQDGSAIELDLALSKLRNVYEILTMIKADRLHELISSDRTPSTKPISATTTESQQESNRNHQSLNRNKTEPQPGANGHKLSLSQKRIAMNPAPTRSQSKNPPFPSLYPDSERTNLTRLKFSQ